jgi:hypothetical protein
MVDGWQQGVAKQIAPADGGKESNTYSSDWAGLGEQVIKHRERDAKGG